MSLLSREFAGYSIGQDCYREIEKYCLPYGKRVLIVGGPTALGKAMKNLLANCQNLFIVDIVTLQHECTYQQIDRIIETYQTQNIEMIFAVGGGKACDSGKTIADKMNIPVFCFPTLVSNCASYSAMTVIYKADGSLDEFYFCRRSAVHVFMNTDILIAAPVRYLKAGIADTLAKYYECHLASRNDYLDYQSSLGREISNLCRERVEKHTEGCLKEIAEQTAGDHFQEITLTVIVNTGLVSQLVLDDYNGALAHSVCYGLDVIPAISADFYHGELVGYGLLVQCRLDKDFQGEESVRRILKMIDCPITLKQLGLSTDRELLEPVLEETIQGPDMSHLPYPIDKQMVYQAMSDIENV